MWYQEISKLGAKININNTGSKIQRINVTNSWFFEIINKIDKNVAKLNKGRGRTYKLT